jgi:hypothetical protein
LSRLSTKAHGGGEISNLRFRVVDQAHAADVCNVVKGG